MKIRYGDIDDAAMLANLGAKTFLDTYAKDNTPENIDAHIKAFFSPQIQRNELAAPENVFLIAEHDDIPIGYAQVVRNRSNENIKGTKPLELQRIYATKEHIGKGVGSALMNAALQEARKQGCDSVWLGVWEKNLRAIRFYQKWGFREVGTYIFQLGEDPQRDFIMELRLTNDSTGG